MAWRVTAPVTPEVIRARHRFGARMHQLRRAAGLNQEQLAERLQVDRKTISRTEHGHHSPTLDGIVTLAGALDVEPVELFRW